MDSRKALDNQQTVKLFFNLLPKELRLDALIAGGAAVRYDLADDVDIWILGKLPGNLAHSRILQTQIAEQLFSLNKSNDELFAPVVSFDVPDLIDVKAAAYMTAVVKLVEGTYLDKKFQVLHAESVYPMDLLASFDLSVHQAALTYDGAFVTAPSTTKVREPIQIVKLDTPIHTFKRYYKLFHRYGAIGPIDNVGLTALLSHSPVDPLSASGF